MALLEKSLTTAQQSGNTSTATKGSIQNVNSAQPASDAAVEVVAKSVSTIVTSVLAMPFGDELCISILAAGVQKSTSIDINSDIFLKCKDTLVARLQAEKDIAEEEASKAKTLTDLIKKTRGELIDPKTVNLRRAQLNQILKNLPTR